MKFLTESWKEFLGESQMEPFKEFQKKKLVESQRDLLDELWFWKEISQMDLPEGSHKISRLLEES